MDEKKNTPPSALANELIAAIAHMAEMSHQFYVSMISSGADKTEATNGMQGFISAFWAESMNASRRENNAGAGFIPNVIQGNFGSQKPENAEGSNNDEKEE